MTSTGEGEVDQAYRRHRHLEGPSGRLLAAERRREAFRQQQDGFQGASVGSIPRSSGSPMSPTGAWHRDFEEALADAGLPLYPDQTRTSCAVSPGRWDVGRRPTRSTPGWRRRWPRRWENLRPLRKQSKPSSRAGRAACRAGCPGQGPYGVTESESPCPPLVGQAAYPGSLRQIERQVAHLDAEIKKLVAEDTDLARRAEILTSIPGISHITAAGLLVHMPELGSLTAKTGRQPCRAGAGDEGVGGLARHKLDPGWPVGVSGVFCTCRLW